MRDLHRGIRNISQERFSATILIETPHALDSVAIELAGEQSTASSRPVPGETNALIERHGARVESIVPLESSDRPSLPVEGLKDSKFQRARVTLSWPLCNIGTSLPMLWTTILGNATGMRRLTGFRLERIALPASFIDACPRPSFGIHGTRRLTGITRRPIIGTVIKPNVGLTPSETADVVRELTSAGVDFIKDDELIADAPYSPLSARVAAVMPILRAYADRSGTHPMYAFNITGDLDEMRQRHDTIFAAGGTCIMVNLNAIGLAGLISLRKHSQLPIHGHRAGWAAITRSPMLGMDFDPYQAVMRLAGVDQIHVSGLGGKFWETGESVVQSAKACLMPLLDGPDRDDRAMPVLSGGSTVWDAGPTFTRIGSADLIFVSGSGILSHPQGPAAGYRSLRAAWSAALEGKDIKAFAKDYPELTAALKHWPARADPSSARPVQ